MNHFPSKIRSLRGDKTLVEFSKKVGINLKTYQHYEAGTRKPNVNAILQIAVACGVSADWLLGLPERGVSLANSSNNAVNSDHASIKVDSPSCRDCPHLLRLIDILSEKGK